MKINSLKIKRNKRLTLITEGIECIRTGDPLPLDCRRIVGVGYLSQHLQIGFNVRMASISITICAMNEHTVAGTIGSRNSTIGI